MDGGPPALCSWKRQRRASYQAGPAAQEKGRREIMRAESPAHRPRFLFRVHFGQCEVQRYRKIVTQLLCSSLLLWQFRDKIISGGEITKIDVLQHTFKGMANGSKGKPEKSGGGGAWPFRAEPA